MTHIKYNLSKPTPPAMPRLGKGTECVQLLLSQVSKDMHQPLVPMLFPILGAHVSGAEFMYPDKSWKEMCGMLANLVADSGAGKGQRLSEERRVKNEESNGLSEDTARKECWAKPNQTSCSRFAQASLHPSLLFSCSLVLIFRSEE